MSKIQRLSNAEANVTRRIKGQTANGIDIFKINQVYLMVLDLKCYMSRDEKEEQEYATVYSQLLCDILSFETNLPIDVINICMDYYGSCNRDMTNRYISTVQERK